MKFNSELLSEIIQNNIECAETVESKISKYNYGVSLERYDINSESQAKYYKKDIGIYQLLKIPDVLLMINKQVKFVTNILTKIIQELMGSINNDSRILVVGLGNRHISSDSLGAKVVNGIRVTFEEENLPKVMAICPSVLGLTGIETVEIIRGVVNNVKPTHMILIDSLCASNISRLGKSIQVTNTGICPGSGIGNKRKCIGRNLVKNTVSIGVPLLIYARTFIENAFDENSINLELLNKMIKQKKYSGLGDFLQSIKSIYNTNCDNVVVSIKDIEECVSILAKIISEAINNAIGVVKE